VIVEQVLEAIAAKRAQVPMDIEYSVLLGDLTQLNADQVIAWRKKWQRQVVRLVGEHPLDVLYDVAPTNSPT